MSETQTTGQIEHVAPSTLTVATNVRTEATLEKEFLDSIRANGVLQPVVAYRDSTGLHVRYGQRRTLAAQQVELATIPVYVVSVDHGDDAQRIIEQLVENDQREALTDHDRVQAWKQLEIEGLSVTQIAKRTGTKRDTVKTGITVASNPTGTALIETAGLTLDQAALLLEFEDSPELVADLTQTAHDDPGFFPVAVQRERDEREKARRIAEAQQEEAAKGHTILTSRPNWDDTTYHSLHSLSTADGARVTAEDVQGKDGVCVFITAYSDIDTTYYVTNPETLGYTSTRHSDSNRGPMTDEQKAERKTLIANNKEWDAATTVRVEWLTNLIARKTLPKDTAHVIATHLTGARDLVATVMSRGNSTAKTLLGLENGYADTIPVYLEAHPTKATHITLAIVLGGIEQSTSREHWRYPRTDIAEYLQTLQAWGHTLSPVERIAARLTPDA